MDSWSLKSKNNNIIGEIFELDNLIGVQKCSQYISTRWLCNPIVCYAL